MMRDMPSNYVLRVKPGDWFCYRNQYGQRFRAQLQRRWMSQGGALSFFVQRAEWPREERLPFAEFVNGDYVLEQ